MIADYLQLVSERFFARLPNQRSCRTHSDLPPMSALPRTSELQEDVPLPTLKPLLERVEETSPLLRATAARVQEAERRQRVAELEGYPDFDVGIGYRVRRRVRGDAVDGDDFLMASVTIRLPLNRSKWRARVAEAGALLRRARAQHRSARALLRGALRARFADLVRADAELELLEHGLVPQARQSLASSRAGYEVDN